MINFFFKSSRERVDVDTARDKYPDKYLIFDDYDPLTCIGNLAGYMEQDDIEIYNQKYACDKFRVITPDDPVGKCCNNQEDYCSSKDCDDCDCCIGYDLDDEDVPPRRRCKASRKPKSCVPWVVGAIACVFSIITLGVIRRKHNA